MGQFESTHRNYNSNDELINALIKRGYIRSINVEKVFRSVDRGLYYINDKLNAYRDMDWLPEDEILSAPSTYATVLESFLDLHKGHKFLNIGSGTGYLSTLAGLVLGSNGVNHGIEIQSSLVDIAYQKLEVFEQNSAAIDYFEFCKPVFIKGNACELMSVGYYDRIYCEAQVTPEEFSIVKAFIKIGGVIVAPFDGKLLKDIRESEHLWKTIQILEAPISRFLVTEKCSSRKVLKFPTVEPLSLQELCRSTIRASIRNCLIENHPGLQMRTKCKPNISDDQNFSCDRCPIGEIIENFFGEVMCLEKETSDLDSTPGNEAKNHSSNSSSDSWETVSNDSSESDDEENNHNGEDGIYNTLVDGEIDYGSDTDSEVAREFIKYRFLSNRKENELSKLLKIKINLLPVPAMLKVFLNHNNDD